MLDAQARLATPATIRTYGDRIPTFVNWCKPQKITALADIKPDTVRRYFVHLAERKFSDITIMGVGRCLRAWFNFCVREKLISESPMATVKVPKAGKRILKAIGMDDIKKLLDACEIERDEAIILFMLDTGCRATELISLNCGDIDTKTGEVQYSQNIERH